MWLWSALEHLVALVIDIPSGGSQSKVDDLVDGSKIKEETFLNSLNASEYRTEM